MVACLKEKLKADSLKPLVGNRGYRIYLKIADAKATIDQKVLRKEARYDGKYVLKTNCDLPAYEAALVYKRFWQVKRAFCELKSWLYLRPVYHWTELRVRGRILMCFLALVLQAALRRKLRDLHCETPYHLVLEDLRELKAVQIELDGQTHLARTEFKGSTFEVFKAPGLRPSSRVKVVPSA